MWWYQLSLVDCCSVAIATVVYSNPPTFLTRPKGRRIDDLNWRHSLSARSWWREKAKEETCSFHFVGDGPKVKWSEAKWSEQRLINYLFIYLFNGRGPGILLAAFFDWLTEMAIAIAVISETRVRRRQLAPPPPPLSMQTLSCLVSHCRLADGSDTRHPLLLLLLLLLLLHLALISVVKVPSSSSSSWEVVVALWSSSRRRRRRRMPWWIDKASAAAAAAASSFSLTRWTGNVTANHW